MSVQVNTLPIHIMHFLYFILLGILGKWYLQLPGYSGIDKYPSLNECSSQVSPFYQRYIFFWPKTMEEISTNIITFPETNIQSRINVQCLCLYFLPFYPQYVVSALHNMYFANTYCALTILYNIFFCVLKNISLINLFYL